MTHAQWHNEIPDVINTAVTSQETRTGVTTSVVEEFSESRNDRLVSTNIAQTMRARDIVITGENFKPNTRYYTFFDGLNVAPYITPTSSTYGVAAGTTIGTLLRSDNLGTISATFSIPNTDKLNFTTGSKTLKVTDSSTNSPESRSQGTAIYDATGTITVMQEDIVSTRNGRIILSEVTETRQTEGESDQDVEWVDPLAQSFLVTTPGGIFVTSVELYFGAKDIALPVSVQIRHMQNGYPTNKVLPFAEKSLAPEDVNTSADASTSTKFVFPSPVFLEGKRDYCIVVWTNSNVYTCWVSEMGGRDIATNDFIDAQPYAGSLFKSQNNVTWTADQLRDLKMTLNRAKFTIGTSANVVFDNGAIETDILGRNPIETIYNTKTFRVYHYSHGNYDQTKSNITIAGVTGDRTGSVFSFNDDTIAASDTVTADAQTLLQTSVNPTGGIGCTATITTSTSASTSIVITNPGQGYSVGDAITFTKDGETLVFTVAAVKDTLGGIPIEYIGGPIVEVASDVTNSTSITLTASNPNIVARPSNKQTVTVGTTTSSNLLVNGISGTTLTVNTAVSLETGTKLRIGTTHSAGSSASGATSAAKIMSDMDEYLITIPDATWPARTSGTTTSPNYQIAVESVTGGGEDVTSTPNIYFDTLHTAVPSIELPNTAIVPTFLATSATQATYLASPAPSYTKDSTSTTITLNDNNYLSTPKIVASGTNESNEMGSVKSFTLSTYLSSTADNVSSVLDIDTIGAIAIQNRINNIDSSTDIESGTFISDTLSRGSNNAAVYMTKKVQLTNPANSIHVLFDGFRSPDASGINPEILLYYKVMGPDDNLQFNDIGWTSATIKSTIQPDATAFKEHTYEIESLEDFTAFSIKIVLQSVNSANVPLIENFRAIALST